MIHHLPTVNAVLNGISVMFLIVGRHFIKQDDMQRHRFCMVGAFSVSVLFLISYLTYHFNTGTTRFTGTGLVRPIYLTILGTHTVLAAAVPFLAILTLHRALKGRFDAHRRLARWTFPIWVYVGVTGVVIYLMLYQIWPSR